MPDSSDIFDAEFDAMTSATQKRAALRAASERADKRCVVIGNSPSTARVLKAVA